MFVLCHFIIFASYHTCKDYFLVGVRVCGNYHLNFSSLTPYFWEQIYYIHILIYSVASCLILCFIVDHIFLSSVMANKITLEELCNHYALDCNYFSNKEIRSIMIAFFI